MTSIMELVMTSQISKSMDFRKIKKSAYLKDITFFFLKTKKSLITRATLLQRSHFTAEITFN